MLTDELIINRLAQSTSKDELLWQENERGPIFTITNEVRIEMVILHGRVETRLCLLFTLGIEKTDIIEPPSSGILKKKYDSKEDEELARAIRNLSKEISKQLERRRSLEELNGPEIKQRIFKQVFSGL